MAKSRNNVDKLFLNTEKLLYNYNLIKAQLINYKIDLEYLKIDYEKYKNLNSTNTETTNTNISLLKEKEIKQLKNKININEKQIKKIENALDLLSEEEKSLVNYRYFSKLLTPPCWLDVSEKMGFSEKKCRMMRDNIINKIKDLIF